MARFPLGWRIVFNSARLTSKEGSAQTFRNSSHRGTGTAGTGTIRNQSTQKSSSWQTAISSSLFPAAMASCRQPMSVNSKFERNREHTKADVPVFELARHVFLLDLHAIHESDDVQRNSANGSDANLADLAGPIFDGSSGENFPEIRPIFGRARPA